MTQIAPDAFTCPFARQCWQREVFRWLAMVAVSMVTASLTSCAVRYADGARTVDVTPYAAPPGWTPLPGPLSPAPSTRP